MKARHSPGPWRADHTAGGALGIWSRDFKTDSPDVCDVASVPDRTDEANGRVIAAAPDGYALALAIVEYFGNERIDPLLTTDIELRKMARAVVAKVEGRS